MKKNNELVSQILKVAALGMAVCVLVLSIMDVANVETSIVMLSIGLIALAFDTLRSGK